MTRACEMGRSFATKFLARWKRSVGTEDGTGTSSAAVVGSLGYAKVAQGGGLQGFSAGSYATLAFTRPTAAFTVDVWIRPTAVAQGNIIADWDTADTAKQAFRIYLAAGFVVADVRLPSGSTQTLTSLTRVWPNREVHIKAAFSWVDSAFSYIAIALDGRLDAVVTMTGSASSLTATGRDALVGTAWTSGAVSQAAGEVYSGAIGELRCNSDAYSKANILLNETDNPFGSDFEPVSRQKICVVEYDFKESLPLSVGAGSDWVKDPSLDEWTLDSALYPAFTDDSATSGDGEDVLASTSSNLIGMTAVSNDAAQLVSQWTKRGDYGSIAGSTRYRALLGKVTIGKSPSGYLEISMPFRVRYASTGMVVKDRCVQPRLKTAPKITKQISYLFRKEAFGQATQAELMNSDGFFDRYFIEHNVGTLGLPQVTNKSVVMANARFRVLIGGPQVDYASFKTIYDGVVERPELDLDVLSLSTSEDRADVYDAEVIPSKVASKAAYPNVAAQDEDKKFTICWGLGHKQVTGLIINKSAKLISFADDSIRALTNLRLNGNLIGTGGYTVSLGAATVTITSGTWNQNGTYTADVDGYDVDLPCAFIRYWLLKYAGVSSGKIASDVQADDTGETATTIRLLIYNLNSGKGLTERLFRQIKNERYVWCYQDSLGVFKARKIRADDPDAIEMTLTDIDFLAFTPATIDEFLVDSAEAVVQDYPLPPTKNTSTVPILIKKSNSKYGISSKVRYYDDSPLLLTTQTAATNWLSRLARLGLAYPQKAFNFKTGLRVFDLEPLSRVTLSRTRGIDHQGAGSGNWRPFKLTLDPNTWTVDGTFVDEGNFPLVGQ